MEKVHIPTKTNYMQEKSKLRNESVGKVDLYMTDKMIKTSSFPKKFLNYDLSR